ncbi:MAG TPA: Fic family protein, partial [Xanthomonadales bacterium]|nr:Fic family protein [Xanthomonadales bacterium]
PPRANDVGITARDLRTLHAILSADLLRDPMMCGRIRTGPVLIKSSSYIPLSLAQDIERTLLEVMAKATQIADPYEQAFFLLAHLPYLQPFEDCNKRTARVACNIPLLRAGVTPMSWMDIQHDAFTDGLLGIYERCNPCLLAEVFTEGYLRSIERFEVMRRSCEPDPVAVMYRSEIRSTVRSVVLDGPAEIPSDVEEPHRVRFAELVQIELNLLRNGQPGAVVRMRLGEGDIARWRARESECDFPSASTDAGEDGEDGENVRHGARWRGG